jgi:RNA polymerase sigma-70 factor, ECF subfamily
MSLLERLRVDDQDAWRRTFALYGPLVGWWCVRLGATPQDAEDLAQEVFRVAAGRLVDFRRDRPGDTFRGWLRGIARNVVRAHLRTVRAEPRAPGGTDAFVSLQQVADLGADLPDQDDPPSEVDALNRRALDLVRGEFEPRTWDLFWQVAVEGKSPADVAAAHRSTAAAVRQAKARVLRRLRQELGELIA